MIEEKITRYKNGILAAKELNKHKYVDHTYYENKISQFTKMLKFYEDLKVWKEFSGK